MPFVWYPHALGDTGWLLFEFEYKDGAPYRSRWVYFEREVNLWTFNGWVDENPYEWTVYDSRPEKTNPDPRLYERSGP
jgi:hypothetical protein